MLYVAEGVYSAYKGERRSNIFSTQSSPPGRVLSQSGNGAEHSVGIIVLAPPATCCWPGAALRLPPF